MALLSAVIIAFNEEQKIERCIRSLLPVADEVVVIDSFSTDRTVEMARKLGARVIQHPFENYIEQKNFALGCLNHEWALSLDADEALSDTLQQSILRHKNNLTADGYTMNRLTRYCNRWIRHCGWYPDRKLRLFKLSKARWGGINPHDKIIMDPGAVIHHLDGDLLHYSFDSHEEFASQQKKFAAISARHLHSLGKNYSWPVIYLRAAFRFIRDYFLKTGFLEGKAGFRICRTTALAVFEKYACLKKLHSPS